MKTPKDPKDPKDQRSQGGSVAAVKIAAVGGGEKLAKGGAESSS